jgi:hypothetical protein
MQFREIDQSLPQSSGGVITAGCFMRCYNVAMSKPFQFTKRTITCALGWLGLSAAAGAIGALAIGYDLTVAVSGFVVAFNSFWAAVDSLRGRSFGRILLERTILASMMMMAYWMWRLQPYSTDSSSGLDGG